MQHQLKRCLQTPYMTGHIQLNKLANLFIFIIFLIHLQMFNKTTECSIIQRHLQTPYLSGHIHCRTMSYGVMSRSNVIIVIILPGKSPLEHFVLVPHQIHTKSFCFFYVPCDPLKNEKCLGRPPHGPQCRPVVHNAQHKKESDNTVTLEKNAHIHIFPSNCTYSDTGFHPSPSI